MESVSLQEIVQTLRAAGVRCGDVLNVHSRLFAIGAVRESDHSGVLQRCG